MITVNIDKHPDGARLYVLGRRVHHGAFGVALLAIGTWLVASDRRDFPFLPVAR